MKIEELKNQRIKISPHSITCKDEYGKTKGVVTNAVKFRNLQTNRAIDYFSKIRSAGLWGNEESNNVYIVEENIYYLFNLRPIEFYEKYIAGRSGWESETKKYNQLKQLAKNAEKIGTVIPCYIMD